MAQGSAYWRMYRNPRVGGGRLLVKMWTDHDGSWFAAHRVVASRKEAKEVFSGFVKSVKEYLDNA